MASRRKKNETPDFGPMRDRGGDHTKWTIRRRSVGPRMNCWMVWEPGRQIATSFTSFSDALDHVKRRNRK